MPETREQLNRRLVDFGRAVIDDKTSALARLVLTSQLVTELEKFKSNISSAVSEFMLASLALEAGFSVSFIPTSVRKTCDLVIGSFDTEIKTFLDISRKAQPWIVIWLKK